MMSLIIQLCNITSDQNKVYLHFLFCIRKNIRINIFVPNILMQQIR